MRVVALCLAGPPGVDRTSDRQWISDFRSAYDERRSQQFPAERFVERDDILDVVAECSAHRVDAVVLSVSMPGLSPTVLADIAGSGVHVVLMVFNDVEARIFSATEGVSVVAVDSHPAVAAEAIQAAVASPSGSGQQSTLVSIPSSGANLDGSSGAVAQDRGLSDTDGGKGRQCHGHRDTDLSESRQRRPVVIGVWGPAGAPGRTAATVALAAELEAQSDSAGVLVIDADPDTGGVADLAGLVPTASGIISAITEARQGKRHFDLSGHTMTIDANRPSDRWRRGHQRGRLEVLTGVPVADRASELMVSPATWKRFESALTEYDWAVVDLGRSPRAASWSDARVDGWESLTGLLADRCDVVVAVTAADPIGLARCLTEWSRQWQPSSRQTREPAPTDDGRPAPVLAVVNRSRPLWTKGSRGRQIAELLNQGVGCCEVSFVPDDPDAWDQHTAQAGLDRPRLAPSTGIARQAWQHVATSVRSAVDRTGATIA